MNAIKQSLESSLQAESIRKQQIEVLQRQLALMLALAERIERK